jgi:hypothetical protein
MMKSPHSTYAPALAPSDFVLFGYVKQLLREAEFHDRDSLFNENVQILTGLENTT